MKTEISTEFFCRISSMLQVIALDDLGQCVVARFRKQRTVACLPIFMHAIKLSRQGLASCLDRVFQVPEDLVLHLSIKG